MCIKKMTKYSKIVSIISLKNLSLGGGVFVGNLDYFNLLLQDLWICEVHNYYMVNTIPSYNPLKLIPFQPQLEA
jgi:hypothetical protein